MSNTTTSRQLLGAAAIVTVMIWGYLEFVDTKPRAAPVAHDDSDLRRFQEWAYIAKDKEISPGEHLKLVVVPSPWGENFDTKCLVYTNHDFRQSSIICPDADRDFLNKGE